MQGLLYVDLSYNELEGPIPNSKVFVNGSIEALQGNKGLCGNSADLQPCKNPSVEFIHSYDKNLKLSLLIVPSLLGAILLCFAFIVLFIIYKGRKRNSKVDQREKEHAVLFTISAFDGKAMYDEIIKATNEFDDAYFIGWGVSGIVYEAKLQSGNIVAVKKLLLSFEMAVQKDFINEARALTKIRHRNIVKPFGFCSHAQHSFLVYQHLERGSLDVILSREEAKKLDWHKRVNILKGVALAHALSYMHHGCVPPIVHRDISSKNILLDPEYEAHILDFGTAKLLKLDSSDCSGIAGTLGYTLGTTVGSYSLNLTKKVNNKNMTLDCFLFLFLYSCRASLHNDSNREVRCLQLWSVSTRSYQKETSGRFTYRYTVSTSRSLQLEDFVDQRPLPLTIGVGDIVISIIELARVCLLANPQVGDIVISIIELARVCLLANPQARPTTDDVAFQLTTLATLV